MRLASLPFAPAFGLGYGALLGAALVLRTVEIEQALTARAWCALAVLVAGAVLAGAIAAWIGRRLARAWPAALRFVVMAPGLAGGTLFLAGGLYSLLIRDILGQFELDDLAYGGGIVDFVFTHGSAAYLMLLGGWTLLFPWPLAAAGTLAAALFAVRRG
ncbi:hypothetical protein [Labrys wisconsinensis]|uniref:Uncharacterized protein n=1 Tax=Labrys wisconsinensis TaxID=425677 RepID=A0ABU0JKT5_9HYPH|nr:hypothetical protein [Labrys wisconsinensis]MDQ0474893.1 hypothetical protein [Labrys wisconsinensis]